MPLAPLGPKVRRLLRTLVRRPSPPAPAAPPSSPAVAVSPHRRYLSDQPRRTAAFLEGARTFVSKLDAPLRAYLFEKPFDRLADRITAANDLRGSYFWESYQVMNLIQAMAVPFGGRILEVGSGPGWVTEILVGLGYSVAALEPCADMIEVARARLAGFAAHHRMTGLPEVTYHGLPLEVCDLPDASCEGVFFHAALHHVIDEEAGLAQCFRVLRPGGVLGVCESAWHPGDRGLEDKLEEEMARYGTLENPFTIAYLDELLRRHGFVNVRRYHGVNGLFPVDMEDYTLREAAQFPACDSNTLTAQKPAPGLWTGPTTADASARSAVSIEVLEAVRLGSGLRLRLRLTNTGDTAWLERPDRPGGVTVALYQGTPGASDWREAAPRQTLPGRVLPGESVEMDRTYQVPTDGGPGPWYLDLVSERRFWFAARGGRAVAVDRGPWTVDRGS